MSKKALVLEDDKDFVDDLRALVEVGLGQPPDIKHVQKAEEAVQVLSSQHQDFDIVYVDLKLGTGKSGLDFLQEIRDLGISIPIVVLSDLPRNRLSVSGRTLSFNELAELGAIDYVEKGVLFQLGTNKVPDALHITPGSVIDVEYFEEIEIDGGNRLFGIFKFSGVAMFFAMCAAIALSWSGQERPAVVLWWIAAGFSVALSLSILTLGKDREDLTDVDQ